MSAPSVMHAMKVLFKRELIAANRQRQELVNPLFFFVMVITLFPLGVSPSKDLLVPMAPGVVWIAALLSTLIAADGLFKQDYDDGALDQLLMAPQPLFLLVWVKIISHWMVTGLPLLLVSPILGGMLFLEGEGLWVTFLSLLLGTPVMSFIAAIGAALTVGLRRGGVLVSLIALPLYIPVLIFGTGAVMAAMQGYSYVGQLALLGAMLALALTLAPIAVAGALRVSAGQ